MYIVPTWLTVNYRYMLRLLSNFKITLKLCGVKIFYQGPKNMICSSTHDYVSIDHIQIWINSWSIKKTLFTVKKCLKFKFSFQRKSKTTCSKIFLQNFTNGGDMTIYIQPTPNWKGSVNFKVLWSIEVK